MKPTVVTFSMRALSFSYIFLKFKFANTKIQIQKVGATINSGCQSVYGLYPIPDVHNGWVVPGGKFKQFGLTFISFFVENINKISEDLNCHMILLLQDTFGILDWCWIRSPPS